MYGRLGMMAMTKVAKMSSLQLVLGWINPKVISLGFVEVNR